MSARRGVNYTNDERRELAAMAKARRGAALIAQAMRDAPDESRKAYAFSAALAALGHAIKQPSIGYEPFIAKMLEPPALLKTRQADDAWERSQRGSPANPLA